ncbi:MAG: hypothetical protein P0Y55_09405 [Candidatus Cohnella colombiensis]|uniref:Uncharacterized protein n=1 Tax=Candidatus Cohnella colombiensis TaxID=3121368 RepID=A0AA95JDE2_9BACL|nr:MAG: hypothetical protein P0Y55_09405 [Cohnella sp.]
MNEVTTRRKSNKVIISILIVICLCLVTTVLYLLDEKYGFIKSSGESRPHYDFSPGFYTNDDLSVFDKQTGKKITLGMLQDDVEKILGKPKQERKRLTHANEYEGGIDVYFRIDRAAAIFITDSDRFVTMRNIGSSSERYEVQIAYGSPIYSGSNGLNTYVFVRTGLNSFEKSDKLDIDGIESTSIYLMDFINDDKRIQLFDRYYAMTFN